MRILAKILYFSVIITEIKKIYEGIKNILFNFCIWRATPGTGARSRASVERLWGPDHYGDRPISGPATAHPSTPSSWGSTPGVRGHLPRVRARPARHPPPVQLPGQPNSFKPISPLGGPPSGGGVPGSRDRPGRWTHRRQRLEGLQQQQHRVSRGL